MSDDFGLNERAFLEALSRLDKKQLAEFIAEFVRLEATSLSQDLASPLVDLSVKTDRPSAKPFRQPPDPRQAAQRVSRQERRKRL